MIMASLTKPIAPEKTPRGAFSLVELLVAMTVLTLLVAMTAQLTNVAVNTITASNKRLDADGQARVAFSRMGYDFQGMINRKDVDCFFVKNASGNDALYFYSDAPGYFSGNTGERSSASLVGYRIAKHKFTQASEQALYPNSVLERVGTGLLYEGLAPTPARGQITYLLIANSLPVRETTLPHTHGYAIGTAPTWDGDVSAGNLANSASTIADSIFRMEFCFMVKDPSKYGGKTFVAPITPGNTPWTNMEFAGTTPNTTNMTMRQFYSDAAAVVVTVAVLDPKSRVLVTPAMFTDAAMALADGNDPSVAQTWIKAINDGTFKNVSKLPQTVASQVRVYQRFFYLNSK
jgi:type II secretory pathway pseudopilin PulG